MARDRAALATSLKLYAVTDDAWLGERSLVECVEEAILGGVTFVQLRMKHADHERRCQVARELVRLCHAYGVPFVVNDDVECAREVGADGVHVGQSDSSCVAARAALGPDAIIGVSAQTVEQALEAQAASADYLGVGAIWATPTKDDAVVTGIDGLKAICDAVHIPCVAIGGLNQGNLDQLEGTGVAGAALVSAIFAAPDIEYASALLAGTLDEFI